MAFPCLLLRRLLALGLLCHSLAGCVQDPAPDYLRVRGRAPVVAAIPSSRGVLFVFWASWCVPCREETPSLLALARKPPPGLQVVVLSRDEDLAAVHAFFGGPPDPLLHLRLVSAELSSSFAVDRLPSSLLVVAGEQRARFDGPQRWDAPAMRKLLERLLFEAEAPKK